VLREWMGKDALGIHVYIPENMEIVPNSFFLGMADLSDGWAWVDGVFPKVEVAARVERRSLQDSLMQ
jgi:hypothetical protein